MMPPPPAAADDVLLSASPSIDRSASVSSTRYMSRCCVIWLRFFKVEGLGLRTEDSGLKI